MKYEYDFSNFHLPKSEYKILKKHSSDSFQYNYKFESLLKTGLVMYTDFEFDAIGQQIPTGLCSISEKGICYIQYRKSKLRNFLLTTVISLLTLVATVAGIIVST